MLQPKRLERPIASGISGVTQGILNNDPIGILNAALGAGEALIEGHKNREEKDAQEVLSNPLATEGEINELINESTHSLNRVKAENRLGEWRASEGRSALLDAMSNTGSVEQARTVMLEHQGLALQEAGSAGELAGIKEAYAQWAPSMLDQASARRVAETERQAQIVTTGSQRTALHEGGPLAYATNFYGQLSEEAITSGDVDAYVVSAVTTLENEWLEGEGMDDIPNPRTDLILNSIDAVMADSDANMTDKSISQFRTLQKKILTAVGVDRVSTARDQLDADKQTHLDLMKEINVFKAENPGKAVPQTDIDAVREASWSPSILESSMNIIHAAPENGTKTGVAHSDIATDQRKLLARSLNLHEGGTLLITDKGFAVARQAMNNFDELLETLPSEIAQDRPAFQRLLAGMAKDAREEAADEIKRIAARDKADREDHEAKYILHHQELQNALPPLEPTGGFFGFGESVPGRDPVTANKETVALYKELRDKEAPERRIRAIREHAAFMQQWAEEHGAPIILQTF
jgi:hypothetical protein